MTKSFKRVRLQEGDTIYLSRAEDMPAALCTIRSFVGAGGSCICYEVDYQGKRGRLKEFYPADEAEESIYCVARDAQGQLVAQSAAAQVLFQQECEGMCRAYQTLEQARTQASESEILNNYIPPYDILYGMSPDGRTRNSVYIWTASDKIGVAFSEYLDEVHKNPHKLPLHKLYHILHTMLTVTDCMTALHRAGLLYLDLKPSNFLVTYNSAFEINPAHISLYDINTIYNVHNRANAKRMVSAGYCAPEVKTSGASHQSDIYAIGAVLFYALLLDAPNGVAIVYADKKYREIESLVKTSPLVQALGKAEKAAFTSLLSVVLKKCLASTPRKRYAACEHLTVALQQLLQILLPGVSNDALAGTNRQLAFVEKEFDKATCTLAVQNLLFTNPLFGKTLPQQAGATASLDVLVVGAGRVAQTFLDFVLQVGQVPEYPLSITLVSNCPAYQKELYLASRPALTQFISVDGVYTGTHTPYATVRFVAPLPGKKVFSGVDAAENQAFASRWLGETDARYLLMAWDDDAANAALATAFVNAAKVKKHRCEVHFFCAQASAACGHAANPVFLAPDLVQENCAALTVLDQMAFNVHLSWTGWRNIDMGEAKAKFAKTYNYASSRAFAIAVIYKLWSVGIVRENLDEAAVQYQETIKDTALLCRLGAFEHRRWIMEKVVDGWQAPPTAKGLTQYDYCIEIGSVKHGKEKWHPCIVHSEAATPLMAAGYAAPEYTLWEQNPIDAALDPLDAMSVALHQRFCKAMQAQVAPLLTSGDVVVVQQKLMGAPNEALQAYEQFCLCLKNILLGDAVYSAQYGAYHKAFLNTLDHLPPVLKDDITARMEQIRIAFFPFVEAVLYRDYKQYDITLLHDIPRILTYSATHHLALVFDAQNGGTVASSQLFSNIAPILAVQPQSVCYLCRCDTLQELSALQAQLSTVLGFLHRAVSHCAVRCELLVSAAIASPALQNWNQEMDALLQKGYLQAPAGSVILKTGEMPPFAQMQKQQEFTLFARHSSPQNPAAIPLQDAISTQLPQLPSFIYQAMKQQFTHCEKCDSLRYLKNDHFILAKNLVLLQKEAAVEHALPAFALDYEQLWEIYQGKRTNQTPISTPQARAQWHRLCDILRKYAQTNDVQASFILDASGKQAQTQLEYLVPIQQYQAVDVLVNKLVQHGVLQPDSQVLAYTPDTCKVVAFTQWAIQEPLEALFVTSASYQDAKAISITSSEEDGYAVVRVRYNHLMVRLCALPQADDASLALLQTLCQQHFINQLVVTRGESVQVSFAYSAARVKELLTRGEVLLASCLYYQVRKAGYFDEIDTNFSLLLQPSAAEDGLEMQVIYDLVLTKGIHTLFIKFLCDANESEATLAALLEAPKQAAICGDCLVFAAYNDCVSSPIAGNPAASEQLRECPDALEAFAHCAVVAMQSLETQGAEKL